MKKQKRKNIQKEKKQKYTHSKKIVMIVAGIQIQLNKEKSLQKCLQEKELERATATDQ